MKNKTINSILLILLLFCITQSAASQVYNLSPVTVTPNLPTYSCGQVITISYELDYTMQQGKSITMTVEYNNTQLQLLSFAPQQSGLFQSVSIDQSNPPLTTNTYQSLPFTDHNYTNSSYFTISFRVINCECPEVSSSVNVNAFMEQGIEEHPVSTPVSVSNQNSGASVSLELIAGSDCGTAMYKIVSVGKDAPTNSKLILTMPEGINVTNVFNTNGAIVPFELDGTNPNNYKWSRSNIPGEDLQIHYVVVQFDVGLLCTQTLPHSIELAFHTHNICDNSDITVTAVRPINCCQPPDPCPTCPPGPVSGSVLIPGVDGGTVNISKWLVKYPFRYFPRPDNCKTHDYFIKIENMTNTDLENFNLNDLSGHIAGSVNAISVTGISVSMSPLIGSSTSTFDFQAHPLNPIISTIPLDGVLHNIYTPDNNGIFSQNDEFNLAAASSSIIFPRWSTMLVKITHRLDDPAVLPPYENKAELRFSANGHDYESFATFTSLQDSYDPVITIDKKVKLESDPDASYASSITINPGETVKYRIRIRNYGMADVPNVSFYDRVTLDPGSSFQSVNHSSIVISGSLEYASDIDNIRMAIDGSYSEYPGVGVGGILIKAAPCPGFAELIIEYTVQAKGPEDILCNSIYTNKASLEWEWTNANGITTSHEQNSEASVNIDLFKNIMYKLEATCDTNNANSWRVYPNVVSGVPGRTIFYRATIKNNNTYTVNGLKMMVQIPSVIGNNISNHNNNTVQLNTIPPLPLGTGLVPLNITGGIGSHLAIDNWLSSSNSTLPVPVPPTISAIYKTVNPLGAGQTTTINFRVTVPINTIGTVYNTSMGVSLGSNTNCPIVRKRDLNLKIAANNACYTSTGCDLILFDKKITLLPQGGPLLVELFNIINAGNFNIDKMEIVVHQPYLTPQFTTTPIQMLGYEIDGASSNSGGYTVSIPAGGERMVTVTNIGSSNFGSVHFHIEYDNTISSANKFIVVPVNVVFKDDSNHCTLCEKTFYFYYSASDNRFVVVE